MFWFFSREIWKRKTQNSILFWMKLDLFLDLLVKIRRKKGRTSTGTRTWTLLLTPSQVRMQFGRTSASDLLGPRIEPLGTPFNFFFFPLFPPSLWPIFHYKISSLEKFKTSKKSRAAKNLWKMGDDNKNNRVFRNLLYYKQKRYVMFEYVKISLRSMKFILLIEYSCWVDRKDNFLKI